MLNIAAGPHSPITDLLSGPPLTAPNDWAIGEVARTMRDANVSSVLLDDGRIVTERDLTRALAVDLGPDDAVSLVAVDHPVTVSAATPVIDVSELMLSRQVRHMVVVDFHGRAIGVVSLRDIVSVLLLAAEPSLSLFLHRVVTDHAEIWVG